MKKSKYGMSGGKNTKYGMKGGQRVKATEMGTESNKQYVKRMFGSGGSTRMTNDAPMESKYSAGKKVMMRTKGGMKGGKNTKYAMKGGKS